MSAPGAAVPSLSDAISGYQSGLTAHAGNVTKQLGTAKDIYETKLAKADQAEAALNTDALKPPQLKPPPVPTSTAPIAIWGSSAMWVAAIGGLLTRRPLTNALTAASAVMTAYRQQDAAAAQQAFDTWKTETDNAAKMAQFSIDSYKAALAHIDTDRKAAAAEFLVTAKSLGDENAAYVAQHYGLDAAVRYVDAMQRHIDTMAKAQPDIDKKNDQLQLYTKFADATRALSVAKQSGDPKKIAAAQGAYDSIANDVRSFHGVMDKGGGGAFQALGGSALSSDAVTSIAERYLAGDKSALSGLGFGSAGSANRVAVQNKIAELMKASGETPAEVSSRLATFDKTAKAFATGQQGNAVRSFSVLLSHFDTLKKLYAALNSGDTRAVNAIKNTFETEFGFAAPTNISAARQLIGDEIIKAVTGAAGALGDRETAQQTISGSSSPEQILGSPGNPGLIDTYSELAVGQLRGLRQQYQSGTELADFDKLLSPDAKRLLHAPKPPTDAEIAAAPRISTKAERDALSSGALYVGPDGNLARKP